MKKLLLPLLIATAAPLAHASIDLIAIGSLGAGSDLSGLSGNLENGVPANILGGLGSGLAWAGGNTFIALPDRGPNAVAYNAALDNTTSYISRFQTLTFTLTASSGGALPYTLAPTLTSTTLLSSSTALTYGAGGTPALNNGGTYYFTGRSDGFLAGSSPNPNNGRLDPEAIRVSADGKSVFVSDEYGPYVYQFDRATGQRIRSYELPANLAVANPGTTETGEIASNTSGRTTNKGMEGLAITPDGKTLIGIMQAPLLQDTGSPKYVRLVKIDVETGATQEFAYRLTTGSGVSEIVAINDHEFMVLERDGKGLGDNSDAVVKQLFKIDLNGATNVTGLDSLTGQSFTEVAKSASPFLDIRTALVAAGIAAKDIPAKIEGIAFGDDIVIDGITKHTLYVANDNDFLATIVDGKHPGGIANPNNFYVFTFTDADLANFQSQQISAVPLPAAAWLFGSAAAGLLGLRRRNRSQPH